MVIIDCYILILILGSTHIIIIAYNTMRRAITINIAKHSIMQSFGCSKMPEHIAVAARCSDISEHPAPAARCSDISEHLAPAARCSDISEHLAPPASCALT
ncbi:MAG: hypothetical protein ACKPKO_56105, partial [Candidatus Fonsibacter sp.]